MLNRSTAFGRRVSLKIPILGWLWVCALLGLTSIGARAAEQGSFDFEVYLPKPGHGRSGYSMAGELERFRSHARLDQAYRLIQSGQFEPANRELLSLLKEYPENLRARTVYMSVLDQLRQYDPLIAQANIALSQQPQFVPALLYRSRAYAATSRYREAIAGFETLARRPELQPSDRISVLKAAVDLYIRTKQFQLALPASTRLLELQNGQRAWFCKGLALDGLNRPEEAEGAYYHALELTSIPAQRVEVLRAVAEALRRSKKWTPAQTALVEALRLAPGDALLLRAAADTEYQIKDYEGAIRHLRQLLTVRQDCSDREFLANILLLRKDWKEAERQFQALITESREQSQRASAYRALSLIAERSGDTVGSAEYLKRAIALAPSLQAREKLANLLIAQGRLAEAGFILGELEVQFDRATDRRRVLLALGNIRMSEKKYAVAAQLFAEAVRLQEDSVTLAAASNAYEQAGDLTGAIENSQRAATRAPSAVSHLHLGALFEKRSDWTQAIKNFETALEESPRREDRIAIYRRIGFASAAAGDYKKAQHSFEEALVLAEGDAGVHRELAETLAHLGRFTEAAAHLQRAIELDDTPAGRRALALAQERAGQREAAISTYTTTLHKLPRLSIDREEFCISLAELETKRGNYVAAADWWVQASEAHAGGRPELLASAAQSLIRAERWQDAAGLYRQCLGKAGPSSPFRAGILENLGFVSTKLGQDEAAADFLRQAIEGGSRDPAVFDNLGFVLYRLSRWRPALDAFLASKEGGAKAHRRLAIAHCYQKLGKPGLAIHSLEQALREPAGLSPKELRQAYADAGYLYADTSDYDAAIRAWQEAQKLESDPTTALSLARLHRLTGDRVGALRQLKEFNLADLPEPRRAEYFDELALVHAISGNRQDSLKAWEEANRIEPTARRSFEIGLARFQDGQAASAIPFLERAAEEPDNRVYLHALAYAYKLAGRLDEAVSTFERLAAIKPGSADVYRELGYLEMRRNKNAAATRWFRRAIDEVRDAPQPDAQAAALAEQASLNDLRDDLARLTNSYDLTAYQGYANNRSFSTALGAGVGADGVVPAGGGFELAYQPPKVGFRNERVFQVFVRAVWNNQPGSLNLQDGSAQIGLGVRYKPLISQNLHLSIERLMPVASGAQQNWMARAMSSWTAGFNLKPARRMWNYSSLFVDSAYLLNSGVAAQFAQFRQGLTFRMRQILLITPVAVFTARHQSPGSAAGSYVQQGGGVSLRFLHHESTYSSRKSSFELLLEGYRGDLVAEPKLPGFSGFRVTAIARY